ncbi:hypothetical protein [Geodermatophilus sp. SYSU D00815]
MTARPGTAAAAEDSAGLRRLSTPRSAAVAGILFALLFGTSLVLLRTAVPPDPFAATGWLDAGAGRIRVAVGLVPFAGIAFLWFIAVIRDHLGSHEDRFFSTVFLGSGLVFLAMVFVATAIAAAVLAGAAVDDAEGYRADVVHFGRAVVLQVSNVYALRMAAVFTACLATIWLRTGLLPCWLAVVSYAAALAMLTVVSLSLWVSLVFPAWALTVSVLLLLRERGAAR